MATVVLAGIAAAAGAAAAAGTGLFFATLFSVTGLTAFAIGAGLSLISQALAPKLDLGTQMGGRSVMTREAAQSRKIVYGRARIGGNIVYLESTGDDNKYLYLVIAVAGHEIDAYEEVWFNDERIYNGTNFLNGWANFVNIAFYKGDQTTADGGLVTASATKNGKWTTAHKLLDTAYMVVRLEHDVDKFAQGLPNISTVIRGKKVLDPSNNTTAWSQNPALCIYDYLRDTKYGLGESAANILTSSVTAAKGVCDETVSLAAGGTQPRYTIDGVVDTASSIKSNIETMTGSMIGRLIYSGGKFEIHAGEYVAPTITVDESMAVGEITVQTKQSRRNAFNGVKGVFVSEDDNYIVADYPAQQSKTTAGNFEVTSPPSVRYKILETGSTDFTLIGATSNTVGLDFTATGAGTGDGVASLFLAQDGEPIYLDMPLPYTINNVRAQRIARLALLRSRQQEAITIPCNLTALKFKIGDNISVTNTRLGYSGKVFEVVGYSMGFNAGQMIVNVEAIETAASIWNWQTSDEEVFLGGGEVDLYDGKTAIAPASISVVAVAYENADGTTNSTFDVTWPTAVDAFTDHYLVEWRLASPANQPYFSQATKLSPFTISNLANSATYNVRVKAVNELGVTSSPVTTSPVSVIDTTAPNAPTSVSAKDEFEQATISWVNPTANDFNHVRIYGSNSATSGFVEIGRSAGTTFTEPKLGTGVTRHYKLKAFDDTENASVYSSVDSATTTQVPIGGIADNAVDTDQIADLAVHTDQLDSNAVTIAKIAASLQSTNYVSGSAGWKIQKSGVVEFEQATIRGEIVANTGVIGGFTVDSNSLIAGSGATRVSLSTANGIHLGNNTFSSAPFRVDRAGALTATSATITGALTLTNVDGTTVEYSGGNLQVGTIGGGNLGASAKFASFFRYTISSGTSVAAPSDSAFTSEFGRAPQENDQLIVNNTATTPDTQAAYVRGSSAWGSAVDNFLSGSLIVDGSIGADQIIANSIGAGEIQVDNLAAINADMGTITAGSISVAFLTGDVTEVYPVGLEIASSMGTSGITTYQDIWIPAPSLGLSKRQHISADFVFSIQNSSSTNYSAFFQYGLQYKGKTNIGTSIGGVTQVSFPSQYRQLVSLTGNVLEKIDNVGGVAKTNNGAGTYGVATVVAVWFDASVNKTYVLMANLATTFSTGDTMFFSVNRFESAGTFVANYTSLQTKMILANTTERFTLPIQQYFGSSTTATNIRPYIIASSNMNNLTGTFQTVRGTMENLA